MSAVIDHKVSRVPPIYPPQTPSAEMNARVIEYTRELFPGAEISIFSERDPEFGDEYMVVDVRASGTIEDLMEIDRRWHRNIDQAAPGYQLVYCLNIVPL